MWITAKDELVCKVCGPMHRKKVKAVEPFVLPTGEKVWGPGVHPNCRCRMRLASSIKDVNYTMSLEWDRINPFDRKRSPVSKARGNDKYNRNSDGQFASVESRRTKFKERAQTDPQVASIVQQAMTMMATPEAAPARPQPKSMTEAMGSAAPQKSMGQALRGDKTMAPQKQKTMAEAMSQTSSMSAAMERKSMSEALGVKQEMKTDRPKRSMKVKRSLNISPEMKIAQQKMAVQNKSMAEAMAKIKPKPINLPQQQKAKSRPGQEKWIPTPDGQAWFGLLGPEYSGHNPLNSGASIPVGNDTEFYTDTSSPGGRAKALDHAVNTHWNRFVHDGEMRDLFENPTSPWNEYDPETGMLSIENQSDGAIYYVDYDAFTAAMQATINEVDRGEGHVTIMAEDPGTFDEETGEWESQETYIDYVDPVDLADLLDLPDWMEENKPTFIATNYFNNHEGWNSSVGTAQNPGDFKVSGEDRGTARFSLYFVEPEDLDLDY